MNEPEPNPFPFPQIWIGGDLGDHRICDSTYNRYEVASLPPVPDAEFDGSFQWLLCQPSPPDFASRFRTVSVDDNADEKWKTKAQDCKRALLADAASRGVQIPDSFFAFMDSYDLVMRLRSPTGCYFEYPQALIPYPTSHGGHFVHFYSDSQDCYLWYLYIDSQQRCAIVASDDLSEPHDDEFWYNERDDITMCASSFESFIYRLWIEDEIWYRLQIKDLPLTSEMVEYLRFYNPNA